MTSDDKSDAHNELIHNERSDHEPSSHQHKDTAIVSSPYFWRGIIFFGVVATGLSAAALYYHWHRDGTAPHMSASLSSLFSAHSTPTPQEETAPKTSPSSQPSDDMMARLSALEHHLTALENDHQPNLTSSSPSLAALEERLSALEQNKSEGNQSEVSKNDARITGDDDLAKRVALVTIAAQIQLKVEANAAYDDELSVIDGLAEDSLDLQFLRAHAHDNVQWRTLAHDFDEARRTLAAAEVKSATSDQHVDIIDKIWIGLKSLVRVTPLTSEGRAFRPVNISQDIENKDYSSALGEWQGLSAAEREGTARFGSAFQLALDLRLHARRFYLEALQSLRRQSGVHP
jgi:hypothetical protein